MKTIITSILLIAFSQIVFSQSSSGVQLVRKGDKEKWKWVMVNNHDKPVVLEIRRTLTNCDGNVEKNIIKRTVYSTKGKEPSYLDDYGFKCSFKKTYYKKEYSVISNKFKN